MSEKKTLRNRAQGRRQAKAYEALRNLESSRPLRELKVCYCGRRIGWAKVEGKRRWFNGDNGELHTCDLTRKQTLQLVP